MDVILTLAGVVQRIVTADSLARAAQAFPGFVCLERTGSAAQAEPGDTIDAQGSVTRARVNERAPLTQIQFLRRMPMATRIKLRTAGRTDDVIADAMHLLDVAQDVRTDDPDTIGFVQYMVGKNLLTQAEADEVLR